MSKKKKFYVVWSGKKPGIYSSWEECKEQIHGVKGAKYKAFENRGQAEEAFRIGAQKFLEQSKDSSKKPKKKKIDWRKVKNGPILDSIAVDAACSGNPGEMEYRGVYLRTEKEIFRKKFELGTNNIGEFLAIVKALHYLQKNNLPQMPIYSDSEIAISWVRQKKCKTKLKRNDKTEKLFVAIEAAEEWLKQNPPTNPIIKWPTERWGEIPADFGRK